MVNVLNRIHLFLNRKPRLRTDRGINTMIVRTFLQRVEPNECPNDNDGECINEENPIEDDQADSDVNWLDDGADRD